MREIRLKELAAYLPYGLKAEILDYKKDYVGKQFDFIVGLHQWSRCGKLWSVQTEGGAKPDIKEIKPILRPITEVENDIILNNGETVNVLDIMNRFWEVEWLGAAEIFQLHEGHINIILSPEELPYDLVQVLLSYHFDVFGLISDNLAIPVTIEFNPYK
jgi:hypothetical protein